MACRETTGPVHLNLPKSLDLTDKSQVCVTKLIPILDEAQLCEEEPKMACRETTGPVHLNPPKSLELTDESQV